MASFLEPTECTGYGFSTWTAIPYKMRNVHTFPFIDLIVTSFRLVMPTLPAADLKDIPSGASMWRDLVREANLRSFLGGALRLSVSTEPLKWAPLGPEITNAHCTLRRAHCSNNNTIMSKDWKTKFFFHNGILRYIM